METTKIDTSPDTLTVTFDFSKPQPFGYYVRQISEIVEEIERRAYARGYAVGVRDGSVEDKEVKR